MTTTNTRRPGDLASPFENPGGWDKADEGEHGKMVKADE